MTAPRTKLFHFVRLPDVPDWLRCGWIAYPSLQGCGHGEWSALCEWLCECRAPFPNKKDAA
jgi:hypothetical protein